MKKRDPSQSPTTVMGDQYVVHKGKQYIDSQVYYCPSFQDPCNNKPLTHIRDILSGTGAPDEILHLLHNFISALENKYTQISEIGNFLDRFQAYDHDIYIRVLYAIIAETSVSDVIKSTIRSRLYHVDSRLKTPMNLNPNGGNTMEEYYLALATGLQFGYWFWNATVQPGMTRFSEDVGAALGEIARDRIFEWFKKKVAPTAQQSQLLDESEVAQKALIEEAKNTLPEPEVKQFIQIAVKQTKKLLSDSHKYSMGDLQNLWIDFGDDGVAFGVLLAKHTLGNPQTGIADELVMEARRNGKFPQLIAAMRQVRP